MSWLRIVIRTGGGGAVGFGHVRRCLTLAEALVRLGAEVQFLCDGATGIHGLIAAQGFRSTPVDQHCDLEQTCKRVREAAAQIVIVDSYDLSEEYLAALRRDATTVVAIDDLALHPFPVDLVVNGAANAAELHYSALPQTRFLLGPQYVILRDEFAAHVDRQLIKSLRVVLITLGGADPRQLTLKVVSWVRAVLPGVELDLILGPLFENPSAIEQACESMPKVVLHSSPQGLRELMLRANLAVSGGGQTCYELAATGTPTIAICMVENQRRHLSALSREGTLLLGGYADDSDLGTKLISRLKALAEDPDCRWRMTLRGRQLVDGSGVKRVANAIAKLAERGCGAIQ